MIQNWVEVVGVLTVILAALIGAFWKLISKAGENKTRYQQDVDAIRAIVISRNVTPEIVSLIEKVETEKGIRPGQSIEDILSPTQSSFAHSLRHLIELLTPINEIERLFLQIISCTFRCAYDMMIMAILPGITIAWVFIDVHWDYFLPLIIFGGLIILIKSILDILAYTRTIRRLIDKDNEIRFGRGA